MKRQPIQRRISVVFDGKTHEATYTVQSKVVTVRSVFGSGATQIGGSTEESIARVLLREILGGAKTRGEF